MRTLARFAVNVGAAASLLAACGGSQPPIGTAGALSRDATTHARVHPASGSYQVLYRFDRADGALAGNLLNENGTLYGAATAGGNLYCNHGRGCGTVYGISTHGAEKLLFAFTRSSGVTPVNALTDVHGTLYGVTTTGPNLGKGSVFSITTSGTETTLYSFGGTPDGATPSAPLINVHGTLYGTTSAGGLNGSQCSDNGCGTVFSVDPSTGTEKVLYQFQGGADGTFPDGLLYANGMLYGTTREGGTLTGDCSTIEPFSGCGTFYSLTLSGTHTVLYRFAGGTDSSAPVGQPINVNGTFYGVTHGYPYFGAGTVYSMSKSGSENVLHSFGGTGDGLTPQGGLIAVKGLLYGTTQFGGESGCGHRRVGCGTVYSVTTSGAESVLYRFMGRSDGMRPLGSLLYLKGTFYGTTGEAGASKLPNGKSAMCCGTVFSLVP